MIAHKSSTETLHDLVTCRATYLLYLALFAVVFCQSKNQRNSNSGSFTLAFAKRENNGRKLLAAFL